MMNEKTMYCSCGSRQTTIAYSEHYKGLVFGCKKSGRHVCRSQDEGMYPTESDALKAINFYVHNYGLRRVKRMLGDPYVHDKDRPCPDCGELISHHALDTLDRGYYVCNE